MAVIIIQRAVNLDETLRKDSLFGTLYGGEIDSHEFIISATRGGADYAFDGTATARFIRADGETLMLSGMVAGGKCIVELPQACYAVPGRFTLTIFNTTDAGVKGAVYSCTGNVAQTTTGEELDPGSAVPDIDDIQAEYQRMQTATDAATAAAAVGNGAFRALAPYNAYDVLAAVTKTNATFDDGVAFTWDAEGNCHISGTATSARVNNMWSNQAALPVGLEPGKSYTATCPSTANPTRVYVSAQFYVGGAWGSWLYFTVNGTTTITVPPTATGARIRLAISAGATVDETLTPKLTYGVSNAALDAKIDAQIAAYGYPALARGVLGDGAILNNITTPGNYIINSGYTYENLPEHFPTGVSAQLEVLQSSAAFIIQRITTLTGNQTFIRRSNNGSFAGRAWVDDLNPAFAALEAEINETCFLARGVLPAQSLNDATTPGYYILNTGYAYTDAPADSPAASGQLEVLHTTDNTMLQRVTYYNTGNVYARQSYQGSFANRAWKLVNPRRQLQGKYVAFGDSLMYGAVWSATKGGALHQCDEALRIPTRIARAVGATANFTNAAIGGIGYVKKQGNQNLVDQITTYNLTGVELVTIHAGANDKLKEDGTLDAICAAIETITAHLKANYPKLQLVIIQPLPSGFDANHDPWTSSGAGGWSLNDFDARVSELCRKLHIGYVNWAGCLPCDNWAYVGYNGSVGPNYTHPTVDEDYGMLGDFIAGKVAAYGQNGASIPTPPTTDGQYRLTATITNGAVAYSWEAVQ